MTVMDATMRTLVDSIELPMQPGKEQHARSTRAAPAPQ